jgi:two-component system, NarL family, response regulator LiaR
MADRSDPPRVVVVDDDALARRLIVGALRAAGVNVVGEAVDGLEALAIADFHRPDLVVMDMLLPKLDGIAATRQITERLPDTVVILLTGAADEETALRGLRAGAAGYLRKDVELEAIPRAVLAALDGQAAIPRALAMRLVQDLRAEGAAHTRPVRSPLTAREWEVLDLVCDGKTDEEIAREFVLSAETIRTHVKHVYRKLGVHSREEAAAAARRFRGL